MDKKTKILGFIATVAILLTIAINFNKILIKKDFDIRISVSCDNLIEKCFKSTDEYGSSHYYKYLIKPANNFPECDPKFCEPKCDPLDSKCRYILCSSDTETEFDICAEQIL